MVLLPIERLGRFYRALLGGGKPTRISTFPEVPYEPRKLRRRTREKKSPRHTSGRRMTRAFVTD